MVATNSSRNEGSVTSVKTLFPNENKKLNSVGLAEGVPTDMSPPPPVTLLTAMVGAIVATADDTGSDEVGTSVGAFVSYHVNNC